MPRIIDFPNGQQLTSSALSASDVQLVFQIAISQMLGLDPGRLLVTTTTQGSETVTLPSTVGLTVGTSVLGIGMSPPGSITAVGDDGVTLTLSKVAAASQTSAYAYGGAGPQVFATVRTGYQPQGQPGFLRTADTAIVIARTLEDYYTQQRNESRARNDQQSTLLTTDYTRCWELSFTFYGPNSGDNARLVKSCLYLDWVHDLLLKSNLTLVLDMREPERVPEQFEGQWWERSDLVARYYEGVTETIVVPTVSGVEITVATDLGQTRSFTAPPQQS